MPTTYDFVLASPFSNYNFFGDKLRELCGQMGLSFFLVDDTWVKEFQQKFDAGEIAVTVMLDLTANQTLPNDPYTKLARAVKKKGGRVIDDPDKTASVAHKGHLHQKLIDNHIRVPETVIVNRGDLKSFRVTDEIRRRVGTPFVVKPAWGDSGVGVIMDGQTEEDLLRSAGECPNSDAFLIQQRLEMQDLGRHKGWFRLFHVCGTIIPCWWDPVSHEYHMVTPAQIKKFRLSGLRRIMRGIARLTEMQKFSSEICLHSDGKLYAVDYVNADPDMNPRSFYPNGVPDEVVRHIVWLLFYEAMQTVKRGQGFFDQELAETERDADWLERRRIEQAEGAGESSTHPT